MTDDSGGLMRPGDPSAVQPRSGNGKPSRTFAADEALRQVQESINEELSKSGGPTDFSREGAQALIEENTRLLKDLALGAIRLARRERLDTVSVTHVRAAAEAQATPRTSILRAAMLAVGGAAAGTGLQELIGLMNSPDALGKQEVLVTAILLVMSTALLVTALVPRTRR